MQIYIYSQSPGDAVATHRKRHGPSTIGYRIAVTIDETLLSPLGRTLVDALECDLSGILDDDDLLPRPIVRERRMHIAAAAEKLGFPPESASGWLRVYGEDGCGEGVTTRQHQFYLSHAWRSGRLEAAINDEAAHPGLYVKRTCHDPSPVQINHLAFHDDPARAAEAWRHMLRQHRREAPGHMPSISC